MSTDIQQTVQADVLDPSASAELVAINKKMTEQIAQANEDKKFDPPPPQPVTPLIVSAFCSNGDMTTAETMIVIGILCIVYGIVAK